ncbi:MAG: hypothetical protein HYY30_00025 [Chloroflexi bacterium]|nr:hypothetical protein [Chloroflexota bacterium]
MRDRSSLAQTVDELFRERLAAGKFIRVTITTTSMWPTLGVGDRLVVRGARPEELCPGDILIARVNGVRLAHRFIGCRMDAGEMFLITKGDSNRWADEPWPATSLLGAVVAVERGGRRLPLRSPRARSTAAIAALLSRGEWMTRRRSYGVPRWILPRGFAIALRAVAALGNGAYRSC